MARLARRQHGVISARQLKGEFGFSSSAISRAVAASALYPLHRGVYAVGRHDVPLQGTCFGAVLAAGERALLSHYSAAWLWGLLATSPLPVHVTSAIARKQRPPIRFHFSRTIEDGDRAREDGIPVTSVARTALDLAARIRPQSLDRLLQRAEKLKLFDLPDFESVLTRNKGHRGAAPLRRAVLLYKPPPFTRSGLERRFLQLLAEDDFGTPATGYNVAGYELDVYWPELRFGVELDVFETHGSRRSFEADRLRREDLKLAGVEMTQVTGLRLDREPRKVLDRVQRLLAQRRRELGLD